MKSKKIILFLVVLFIVSLTSVAMAQTEDEFIKQITREGISATKMLEKANKKMEEFNTYKFDGTMNMETKVTGTVEGQKMDETVNMTMTQEGVFQKPQKVYVKTKAKVIDVDAAKEVPQEQVSEVYMEDGTMYMKIGADQKWIKMDLNPMMQDMQKLLGNKDMANIGMSEEQMKLLGMYAAFDQDAVVEGKNYYVINVDVDKDAFKKLYKEIMDKTFEHMGDLVKAEAANKDAENPEINNEEMAAQMKSMMQAMIENMDIQIGYKFYVNKETKMYENMDIAQKINMNMGEMNTQTYMEGKYKYYDFNKDVKFPKINPEDIQDLSQPKQE